MRKNKLLLLLVLLMTVATGAWAQEPATYKITVAEGTEDGDNWTISPAEAAEGATVTAMYSGEKKVKSVKAVKKAAPAPSVPDGAINAKFSVSATKKVNFSKGNLRYASSKWSFFDNQYEYYKSYSADAWDHFGWSTSATTYGMNTSDQNSDYSGNFVDWGATMGTGWRTLTSDEWDYLFNTRTVNNGTGSGKSYTLGKSVDGVLGVVIYPDDYTGAEYSGSDWASFESAGCVFLPAAGRRIGSTVSNNGSRGYYWSSSPDTYNEGYACYAYFDSDYLSSAVDDQYRGFSVRLVWEVAAPAPAGPTASTLAESTVGMIVGSDGKAYAVADKDNLPSGVTAVAMVAYKNGSNGLAIQLNSNPVSKNWADAKTYAEGLTAVPGGTWRLPSNADWQNMFVGCAVSGDAGASEFMDPINGFNAKIAATGITWLPFNYWSSTESNAGAWYVFAYLGGSPYAAFYESETSSYYEYLVLGCLAF